MIRDEFKKQQKKKKLSEKDLMKIRSMGERAFYTSSITKMKNNIKGMNFFLVFALVFAIILTATMALILFYFKGFNGNVYNVVTFIICIFLWLYILGWLFILKPYYLKRTDTYIGYVKELTDKEMEKQQAIYNKIKKDKTETKSEKGE